MLDSFADELVKIAASNPGVMRRIHNKIMELGTKLHGEGKLQELATAARKAAKASGKTHQEAMRAARKASERSSALRGYGAVGAGTAVTGGTVAGGIALSKKKKKEED